MRDPFAKLPFPEPGLQEANTISNLRNEAEESLENSINKRYEIIFSCLKEVEYSSRYRVKAVHNDSTTTILGSKDTNVIEQAHVKISSLVEDSRYISYKVGAEETTVHEQYEAKCSTKVHMSLFEREEKVLTTSMCGCRSYFITGLNLMHIIGAFAFLTPLRTRFLLGIHTEIAGNRSQVCIFSSKSFLKGREYTKFKIERFTKVINNFKSFNFTNPPSNFRCFKNINAEEMGRCIFHS